MPEIIKRLYITGYKSYEIAVFNQKDPKISIIKRVLKQEIQHYLENGLEWVIVSGELGTETWAGQVVHILKTEYPDLKLGLIFPFEEFGGNWNEANQLQLNELKQQADFIDSVSHRPYQSPQQFRNHAQFLLEHTDGALLVYDEEYPGKTRFFLSSIHRFQKNHPYSLQMITMDDLENSYDSGDSV
ncbi:UPF0398 protein [Enterococcus florum]|uniref:UPF0398 protein NRIC_15560 n=1 Tax=Enterococcus florum TaxID=2480627 RepID=A0A4P5P6U9_9ENTE|nr:DUF1273 domain-containing protein [Enterococcus florum]GCF93665.1 UPF0398 protein [Enterococcus florum]